MIVFSFCSFQFFEDNVRFLKTTQGRGWFDIFCAGLFLITADTITGYIMCSILLVCGLFFVTMGCLNRELGGADTDPNEFKKKAVTTAAKTAVENPSLLS